MRDPKLVLTAAMALRTLDDDSPDNSTGKRRARNDAQYRLGGLFFSDWFDVHGDGQRLLRAALPA